MQRLRFPIGDSKGAGCGLRLLGLRPAPLWPGSKMGVGWPEGDRSSKGGARFWGLAAGFSRIRQGGLGAWFGESGVQVEKGAGRGMWR